MAYVALEKLMSEEGASLYKYVLTTATRANELATGSAPLIETDEKKVATIALREVAAGKVSYVEEKSKGKKS